MQTIGQAYEDMQTQNQHLLQQVTERDDYNIKVHNFFLLVQYNLGICRTKTGLLCLFHGNSTCAGASLQLLLVFFMQLVSESVKTKQAQSIMLSEKQTLAKQLQQVNSSIESLKSRISRSEDQVSLQCFKMLAM